MFKLETSVCSSSEIESDIVPSLTDNLKCISWNVQSIRNKCAEVMEHVQDYDADVVFVSETWMQSNNDDITAQIVPYGYIMKHNRRQNRDKDHGGGVGVILKNKFSFTQITSKPFSSFEHSIIKLKLKNRVMCLVTIYRILFIPTGVFLDEFMELLEILCSSGEIFVLSGDVNIHLDTNESYSNRLREIFETFNLKQYVDFPTHKLGHTLDIILTHSDSPLIIDVESNEVQLSDHFLLSFTVNVSATIVEYKTFKYRNIKSVNNDQFCTDVIDGYSSIPPCNMRNKMLAYNEVMSQIVTVHAPEKSKRIKIVPTAPWFNSEYIALRRRRRKAEKRFKRTGLEIHRREFVDLRKQTTALALENKKSYYGKKINDCNGNSKALFACVNELLDKKSESVLPSHNCKKELANRFQSYFKEKIMNIRKSFQPAQSSQIFTEECNVALNAFGLCTEDELRAIISEYGVNCSPEDPIPLSLLKNNIETFIPIWLNIVNLPLEQGSMDLLKNAILNPLIKELDESIDKDILKNYRPVSNLTFISKLIERVVAIRLETHMNIAGLYSTKQFGYKKNHSTELLLLNILNNLLKSCDKKMANVLLLLDLSAAFDTVDQNKLLKILQFEIGIKGSALSWFKSYLLNRTQKVRIGNVYSNEQVLDYGVPQGSVLGPILFNIYTRSFPKTIDLIGFDVGGFADDHQLWNEFNAIFQVKALGQNLVDCFNTISSWMQEYFLKLNTSKTKILVIAPASVRDEIPINGTFIDGECIRFVDMAKNLGVLLDTELSFAPQINRVVSSCFATIKDISRIKKFLNKQQLKTLVSTLVFSKLDYCNSLYYGISSQLIKKLQVVQNSALRLIYGIRRYDRISTSPIFLELHWLKIKERIVFKILLIVFKSKIGLAPYDISVLLTDQQSNRTNKLMNRRYESMYGQRSFSVAAPKLWNALPLHIREEQSLTIFKKTVKSYLLTNSDVYYQTVNMK